MEHKLGETFEFEGNTLEVSEVEDIERPCVGCFFFGEGHHCFFGGIESCMDEDREDHTNVIFKNSTKTEEL